MDYELAEELHKTGFSQLVTQRYGFPEYEMPTLSELIEACPDDGTQLIKGVGGTYLAEFIDHSVMPYERKVLISPCTTPEEAVARLWLALNKVDTNKNT